MRALTLTQPWAGLVASGLKLVENRPREMIKREDFGKRFAIHASRELDESVYRRIADIAPDVLEFGKLGRFIVPCKRDWYRLSRVSSAVIAVATLDKVLRGWDAATIAEHADALCFSNGENLGHNQVRWFFGPIGYLLRDVVELPKPVPCRGWQGFWTLSPELERAVVEQLA